MCITLKDETIRSPIDLAIGFYRLRLFQAGQKLSDCRKLRQNNKQPHNFHIFTFHSSFEDVRYYFNLRDRPNGYDQF